MYCNECGTQRGELSFCASCGTSFELIGTSQPVETATVVSRSSASASPTPPSEPENLTPPAARKNHRRDPRSRTKFGPALAGILAGVLFIVGAVAVVFWILNDSTVSSASGTTYGSDPVLDQLWDECALGDMQACDTLYYDSPLDSDYQEFGGRCGTADSESAGWCATEIQPTLPSTAAAPGTSVELDFLWEACAEGDFQACDDLYFEAPVGSFYEAFGASCGDRISRPGTCVSEFS